MGMGPGSNTAKRGGLPRWRRLLGSHPRPHRESGEGDAELLETKAIWGRVFEPRHVDEATTPTIFPEAYAALPWRCGLARYAVCDRLAIMLKPGKPRGQSGPRVTLVTGGARGIGLEIVRRFLADGYQVAFVATRAEHVESALDIIKCPENRLYAEAIDVTRQNEMRAFVDRIRARWGEIAILVNNAGISPKRVDQDAPWFSQTSIEEWARVIDVNLNGPFVLIRLLAPAMIAKRYGRIINIGSLAGRAMPLIAGPAYAASKAGLVGLTRAAARDLAPHGITVNCIAPGRILSDLTGPAAAAINRSALSRIPVGRFGTAEEVAHVAAFLASPMAGFITGATIDITGGEFAA